MSRILVSIIATALVVAALAPGAIGGAAAEDVTLTVTVVDSNGDSLSDIPVSVTWDDGNEGPINGTTTPDGRVLFGVPEGADVEVTIEDDRYLRNFPYVVEDVSDETVEVPVSMSGRADVTVVDSTGPVRNATVRVFLQDGGRVVDRMETNQTGESTSDPVERGSYGLQAAKAGYLTNNTDIIVGEGMNNKTVRLRRGSTEARFIVVDETFDTPRPIENATVDIQGGGTLFTLSNGLATTSVSPNRDYSVTVRKDGYDTVTETLSVGESTARLNVSIERTDAISVSTSNQRVVINESTTVTVTDEYNESVAGATVRVNGTEVGQTGDNGALSVQLGTAGTIPISAVDGDLNASTTVQVFDPNSTDATATATANATETATVTATASTNETETTTETSGESGPGFGILAALLALASVLVLARQR